MKWYDAVSCNDWILSREWYNYRGCICYLVPSVGDIYRATKTKRLRNDLLTLSRFLTITYLKIPLILVHRFTIASTVFNISMKNFEWVANESLRITKMRYHFDRDKMEVRIVIQIYRKEFFSDSTCKMQ